MIASTAKLIPLSNSILTRQQELGNAIWTYLWVLDHITQVKVTDAGIREALVSDGQVLKVTTIAREIGVSVRAVNRHLAVLANAGLISRGPAAVEGFLRAQEVAQ
jgi:predicted transcriptional regulator